jgi:hypothetical protein
MEPGTHALSGPAAVQTGRETLLRAAGDIAEKENLAAAARISPAAQQVAEQTWQPKVEAQTSLRNKMDALLQRFRPARPEAIPDAAAEGEAQLAQQIDVLKRAGEAGQVADAADANVVGLRSRLKTLAPGEPPMPGQPMSEETELAANQLAGQHARAEAQKAALRAQVASQLPEAQATSDQLADAARTAQLAAEAEQARGHVFSRPVAPPAQPAATPPPAASPRRTQGTTPGRGQGAQATAPGRVPTPATPEASTVVTAPSQPQAPRVPAPQAAARPASFVPEPPAPASPVPARVRRPLDQSDIDAAVAKLNKGQGVAAGYPEMQEAAYRSRIAGARHFDAAKVARKAGAAENEFRARFPGELPGTGAPISDADTLTGMARALQQEAARRPTNVGEIAALLAKARMFKPIELASKGATLLTQGESAASRAQQLTNRLMALRRYQLDPNAPQPDLRALREALYGLPTPLTPYRNALGIAAGSAASPDDPLRR